MSTVKTRKFLIASHGRLASGIKSSLEIIVGEIDNVFLIEAYVDENKSLDKDIIEVFQNMTTGDELIVFTDLLGGSITNQIAKYALQDNIHIISGFNLPLLVELLLSDEATPTVELIENAIINARAQIVYVNELMNSVKDKVDND